MTIKPTSINITPPALPITYEVGSNEPLHPDLFVSARMMEIGMSACKFGCKIYKDPWSNVVVLAHNSAYGCTKTKDKLDNDC